MKVIMIQWLQCFLCVGGVTPLFPTQMFKNLKINIKKTVASLLVCCLLFGSLSLSSCSPKNNLTNRNGTNSDGTTDIKEEKESGKVGDSNENKDESPTSRTMAQSWANWLLTVFGARTPKTARKDGRDLHPLPLATWSLPEVWVFS